MGSDIIVFKIVIAAIFALILINVVRPGISVIGLITCPNCNVLVNAFIYIIVPIGAAYAGISKIISIFSRRGGAGQ